VGRDTETFKKGENEEKKTRKMTWKRSTRAGQGENKNSKRIRKGIEAKEDGKEKEETKRNEIEEKKQRRWTTRGNGM
jgi:hypothetical protein